MNDKHPDIDSLLSSCLSGNASLQEMQKLEEWRNASWENRKLYDYLKDVWLNSDLNEDADNLDFIRDRIWVEGTREIQQDKKEITVHRNTFFWRRVAIICLLIIVGAWQGYLLFNGRSEMKEKAVALVKKVNPVGLRSTHVLPDGTKIWLNVESSLVYPDVFSDTLRWVRLNGEAFFNVATDPSRPFVVEAADVHTKVFGTAFNIKAYPEDLVIKVSLLEGRVQVRDVKKEKMIFLQPGEELLAPKDHGMFTKQAFTYERNFGWKDGILILDGVDFEGFRSALEKWYGVEIIIKGGTPNDWNIRARYHNESLQHVLTDVSFNKNIQFEIIQKRVILTFL